MMKSLLIIGVMFLLFVGIFTVFGRFAARLRAVEPKQGGKKPD